VNWSCVETTAIRRDGQKIKVDLTFSHMQLSDTQWFVGTFRDTTQRKIEQARLRLNERAMEATGEGILITDAIEKNTVLFLQTVRIKYYGVALEKILGQSGRMFFTAEDLLAAEKRWEPLEDFSRAAWLGQSLYDAVAQTTHRSGMSFQLLL
jgi:PAS domain-containing protein